jgi:hypothetical protein
MTNADYVAALEAIPKVRAEPKEHAFRGIVPNRQFTTGHFARQSDEISAHLNCGQQATYNSRLARVHMD